MGLFTRDCYDEDRDARIAEIGQVAYDKEQEEYAKKYREEHPEKFRVSITEPCVRYGDVIAYWNPETKTAENEAYVEGITESGEIIVTYLDNRNDGQLATWKGEYRRMASAMREH